MDDGRPCEPNFAAFETATPRLIGLGEGVRFQPGAVSQPVSTPKQSGNLRVCGYLYGPVAQRTLAISDQVVAVRLPTGTAALALDPARPVHGRPLTLRVTGSVEVPAMVDVLGATGACSGGETVTQDSRSVPAGPFAVTWTGVDVPDEVRRLCLRVTPATLLDAPNDGLVLASVERPVVPDLGAVLSGLRARLTGRRVEVSARVTGRLDGPLTVRVDGADCLGDPTARARGGRASASCLLAHAPRLPGSVRVSLVGRSRLGADLSTPPAVLDIAAFARAGRLVVPGRSIGVVRLGMTLADLLAQGAQGPAGALLPSRKLILPATLRDRSYAVDGVLAVVRGGRVRAIFSRGAGDRRDEYRTAHGLTTRSSPVRAALRRLAPGARCRPLAGHPSASDLCRIGPSTYWGPGGRTSIQDGFFTIWPGARER